MSCDSDSKINNRSKICFHIRFNVKYIYFFVYYVHYLPQEAQQFTKPQNQQHNTNLFSHLAPFHASYFTTTNCECVVQLVSGLVWGCFVWEGKLQDSDKAKTS